MHWDDRDFQHCQEEATESQVSLVLFSCCLWFWEGVTLGGLCLSSCFVFSQLVFLLLYSCLCCSYVTDCSLLFLASHFVSQLMVLHYVARGSLLLCCPASLTLDGASVIWYCVILGVGKWWQAVLGASERSLHHHPFVFSACSLSSRVVYSSFSTPPSAFLFSFPLFTYLTQITRLFTTYFTYLSPPHTVSILFPLDLVSLFIFSSFFTPFGAARSSLSKGVSCSDSAQFIFVEIYL